MLFNFIYNLNIVILWYFVIIALGYTILLLGSIPDLIRRFRETRFGEVSSLLSTAKLVPVTVIVPVFNEGENIMNCVDSLLNNTYNELRIVLINDASTDDTLEILTKEYELEEIPTIVKQEIPTVRIKRTFFSKIYPNLTVIDKEHSGIGGTLNVGINAAETPFFMSVDADSIAEPDAIAKVMYAALSEPNTIAVGGAVYILNNCVYANGKMIQPRLATNYATALQTPEYIRSFIFSRCGWNMFKGALSFSGTSTLFDKAKVVEIGGYDLNNPAQDAEIIVNLHRYMRLKKEKYKILYVPNSFMWTDVPHTMIEFWHQRINWQRGLLRSMFLHLNMFMNPRYGIIGLFNYPFFLLSEVLGPIIEFTAYTIMIVSYFLGILDATSAGLLILVSWGFVTFLTMATVLLNYITFNKYSRLSDGIRLFFIVFLETFGFRQYLTVCRVIETFRYGFKSLFTMFGKSDKQKLKELIEREKKEGLRE